MYKVPLMKIIINSALLQPFLLQSFARENLLKRITQKLRPKTSPLLCDLFLNTLNFFLKQMLNWISMLPRLHFHRGCIFVFFKPSPYIDQWIPDWNIFHFGSIFLGRPLKEFDQVKLMIFCKLLFRVLFTVFSIWFIWNGSCLSLGWQFHRQVKRPDYPQPR